MKKTSPWGNPNSMPIMPMMQPPTKTAPQIAMTPQMVGAIKKSPKGVLPPGLARYLAAKKAAKAKGG